jgi:hypothetical protein
MWVQPGGILVSNFMLEDALPAGDPKVLSLISSKPLAL